MRSILAFVLALACSTTWADAGAEFTYKGVKLGDSIEVFKAALPLYSCDGDRCSFDAKNCERGASVRGAEPEARFKACLDGASFGGAPVTWGSAQFVDGKLAYIRLTIESDFLDLAAGPALEAKFGKPQAIDETPVTNRMGAKFKNWVKTWSYKDQTMRATLRSGTVDKGVVTISNAAFDAMQKSATRKMNQAGANDF